MRFLNETNIDFVGIRKYGYIITTVLILASIAAFIFNYQKMGTPFYWGLDFRGGISITVDYTQPISEETIRTQLAPLALKDLTIQRIMTNGKPTFIIRTTTGDNEKDAKTNLATNIITTLKTAAGNNNLTVLSQKSVGSSVANDFINRASWAVVLSWLGIIVYLAIRFEFKFATAGVFALVHDTIITLGALALFQKEFSLVIVAAILTNIGYSINDTIIIYDRIREDRRLHSRMTFGELINLSTNQTLSRTILTVLTVLTVALSLFFFGGAVLHDFAFTIIIGVFIGTFSSVFVAGPIIMEWINWEKRREAKKAQLNK